MPGRGFSSCTVVACMLNRVVLNVHTDTYRRNAMTLLSALCSFIYIQNSWAGSAIKMAYWTTGLVCPSLVLLCTCQCWPLGSRTMHVSTAYLYKSHIRLTLPAQIVYICTYILSKYIFCAWQRLNPSIVLFPSRCHVAPVISTYNQPMVRGRAHIQG